MGMDSRTLPPIPDLAIVAETVRLATKAEDERYAQRPPEWPECRCDDLDSFFRPRPAADALLAYIQAQPDVMVAGLYALFRLGDRPYPTPAEAVERYRSSFEVALQPMHSKYGADGLSAKGSLAAGLRHGLRNLHLEVEPVAALETVYDMPKTAERITQ